MGEDELTWRRTAVFLALLNLTSDLKIVRELYEEGGIPFPEAYRTLQDCINDAVLSLEGDG